jgi:hypothetical protein
VEEPRFLVDGAFMARLSGELEAQCGADEASRLLLQLGFVHGLRDALRALDGGVFETRGVQATPARLGMRFSPRRPGTDPDPVIHGAWPERGEAQWRTRSPVPVSCIASTGYTSGWLSGLFHSDMLALETQCASQGAGCCRFAARAARDWAAQDDATADHLLTWMPFGALRELVVGERAERAASGVEDVVFDPDSPAVHVWGPVMVVPFAGADETLRAVELIGRDPGAAQVAVVVVNLAGTLVDEGFGAVALERVLEAIAGWGAEAILTGVSALSEPVVAGLEHPHLLVKKTLQEAIAAAFQIAEATRRNV